MLDEIVDSTNSGIPIGNYLSQYFGNFYLAYFDHWIKEEKGVQNYIRYMDDAVILHRDKHFLHDLRKDIKAYLVVNLNLSLKENWQVFPTYVRGVDFVGYRHFGDYVLLRKDTAKRLMRKTRKVLKKCQRGEQMTHSEWCSVNSYKGWVMWCDGHNLTKKHIEPLMVYDDKYYKDVIKGESKRNAKVSKAD